jgi:hypothetical protein
MIKLGRLPPWLGGMAFQTIGGKVSSKVTGVDGCIKVILMTGETLSRNIGIISPCVALIAVNYRVPFR